MRKYSVIKNGIITNQWFSDFADENYYEPSWGLPERWLADSPMSPLSEEQKAMALETRTVEVMGEQVVEYRLPSEYEIDVKDITAEVQAEKQAKEAKKFAKEKRKADRKAIDFSKNLTTKQLQEIVKNLVEDLEG